jgi:hypothetical protein
MVALVGVCVLQYSFVVYVPFYERFGSGVVGEGDDGGGGWVLEWGNGRNESGRDGEGGGREGEKAAKDYLVIN